MSEDATVPQTDTGAEPDPSTDLAALVAMPPEPAVEPQPGPVSSDQPALPVEWLASVPEKVSEPEPDTVTVRIVSAPTSPVQVGVNGRFVSIRIGEDTVIPAAHVAALRNSGVIFDIL